MEKPIEKKDILSDASLLRNKEKEAFLLLQNGVLSVMDYLKLQKELKK